MQLLLFDKGLEAAAIRTRGIVDPGSYGFGSGLVADQNPGSYGLSSGGLLQILIQGSQNRFRLQRKKKTRFGFDTRGKNGLESNR